jgi:aminopeptidase N
MRLDPMPATPEPVRLADYQPPPVLIDEVALTFRLHPSATRVLAVARMRPNTVGRVGRDLRLDGEKLRLISASIDGVAVTALPDDTGLTIPAGDLPAGPFEWRAEVEIDPAANTALEGLYMSRGMYCTQCEAEGFRKITFWPDRPDVMARFRVRIESDLPVLLSNGNPAAQGPGWSEWDDPWPKPSYLFALVAGDLVAHRDRFTTCSGRQVDLAIWVRDGDQDRCAYAMDALKRSMAWDETAYGREYDLDVFNIVAVDDFNMGAMENKGLNIFNAKYVLASPDTATDLDYERIEGIIAHEYFHNWTGNRITCRDWFQLCLKEGLTVFRDQQFSGDMRSRAVKRIQDVQTLRARQFREDQGPLAHPVRPESYVEINNFYTATVYEKGAEVIGMLKRLVGDQGYQKALSLYFDRHDGQACTIEDWIAVFEDATGRDLKQFALWYGQAGTPRVTVAEDWDGQHYALTLRQETSPTPGQPDKAPLVIPIAFGLLGADGREMVAPDVIELDAEEKTLRFALPERPVPSLNRGFSAPVILDRSTSANERAFLLARDSDPFNRWEAGQLLARDLMVRMVNTGAKPETVFFDAMAAVLADEALDPAFRALALSLPSEDEVFEAAGAAQGAPDPMAVHGARTALDTALAQHLGEALPRALADLADTAPYSPDAAQAGRRALKARLLGLLSRLDSGEAARRAFAGATNMTDTMTALTLLVREGVGDAALAAFRDRWHHDRLVMDKWFSVQAAATPPARAADVVTALTVHSDFDWKNPNRFRSLLGAFAMSNLAGFHRADGAGYRLMADWLIRLDPLNPQTTARVSGVFETWSRFDPTRQKLIRAELARIAAAPGLSRDTGEMVTRMLA